MVNNEELVNKTNDLIASLTYYRFVVSKAILEDALNKNVAVDEHANDNVFKKGLIKVGNSIKKSNTEKLDKEYAALEKAVSEFERDCSEDTIYQYGATEDSLKNYIKDFLADDSDDYLKYQVALSVLIDKRYDFPKKENSISKISCLLFNDEKRLSQIDKLLNKNLKKVLCNDSLDTVGKTALIALGISLVASIIIGGVAIKTTALIAGVSIAGGIVAFGATCAKDIFKDEIEYKEALRKLKPDDLGAAIAIRLTLIELIKDRASKETIMNLKESILKDVDYIRSDSEFLYIIEKVEENDNKQKASICNRTTDALSNL